MATWRCCSSLCTLHVICRNRHPTTVECGEEGESRRLLILPNFADMLVVGLKHSGKTCLLHAAASAGAWFCSSRSSNSPCSTSSSSSEPLHRGWSSSMSGRFLLPRIRSLSSALTLVCLPLPRTSERRKRSPRSTCCATPIEGREDREPLFLGGEQDETNCSREAWIPGRSHCLFCLDTPGLSPERDPGALASSWSVPRSLLPAKDGADDFGAHAGEISIADPNLRFPLAGLTACKVTTIVVDASNPVRDTEERL